MNRDLPPLAALRAFEATARRMSVRDAAEQLGVSASAVSHRLRKLERAIGVKLFHRLNRRLVLTDAGSVYLSRIAPAYDAVRAATAEIAGLTVLALDNGFDLISKITGQPVEALRG